MTKKVVIMKQHQIFIHKLWVAVLPKIFVELKCTHNNRESVVAILNFFWNFLNSELLKRLNTEYTHFITSKKIQLK